MALDIYVAVILMEMSGSAIAGHLLKTLCAQPAPRYEQVASQNDCQMKRTLLRADLGVAR